LKSYSVSAICDVRSSVNKKRYFQRKVFLRRSDDKADGSWSSKLAALASNQNRQVAKKTPVIRLKETQNRQVAEKATAISQKMILPRRGTGILRE
jgi:pantothenate kinase